ncbi:Ribosomal RNA adenine methylase transferase [Penicillium vulpinum]|nr:Ribosomal RNA adenine methylase transferase [Penicillium vulpinum]KAJ5970715.1 Ribosomal RNA adenine methylase transferase [Penicillium vulpinum]
MTAKLYPVIMKYRGKVRTRQHLVNEDLLDNILERVSPYLHRNQPVDVLDLWPGDGVWSSKVNELLQPRRHVLLEPSERYHGLLTPLVQSKSCYKLVQQEIYGKSDWSDFMATNFPEQGPQNREGCGIIPKNDTLLVVANLPDAVSATNHFTPSRWFLNFLNTCLKQTELNMYGAVRVLATMSVNEVSVMLPRSVTERARTGVFAETIGLHNIEIASPHDHERSPQSRGWDSLTANAKRVAERAAAHGIITPPDRQLPPLEVVRQSTRHPKKEAPYQPRVSTSLHKKIFATIDAADKLGIDSSAETTDPKAKGLIRKRGLAFTALARDNLAAYNRHKLTDMILEMDEAGRTFARAAADPKESVEGLKAMEDHMASLESNFATFFSSVHHAMREKYEHTADDARLTRISNNFDDSYLVHDRRPFEPLYIHSDEIYPRTSPGQGVLYFEANSNPPALKKTSDLPSGERNDVFERFFALLSCVGIRGKTPVSEILERLFPMESINDIVRDIPSLAIFAGRRLKSGYGPMPLPDGSTSDPAFSYQENIDYDLSNVRFRILSTEALVDIAIKYEQLPEKLDIIHFGRALGGTLTHAQLGGDLF